MKGWHCRKEHTVAEIAVTGVLLVTAVTETHVRTVDYTTALLTRVAAVTLRLGCRRKRTQHAVNTFVSRFGLAGSIIAW